MPVGELSGLVLATLFFILVHVVPATPLRAALVGRIGEGTYSAVFSVISLIGLVWMVMAFNAAPNGAFLWYNAGPLQYLSILLMFIALVLGIGGLIGSNPTSVGGKVPASGEPATGFVRITRHPFLTSVVIWSLAHLIVRGDLKALIFFGGLGLLSAAGTQLIDGRRARSLGAEWDRFAAVTSVVPFLAILQGRNRLAVAELKWWRLAIGIVLFLAILHFHTAIMGVSPLP
ncbi:MAG: NnrU family protein [Minwuia sp.]|uniref:NnrU family protein n=1 Tax=Minwuia sp. TaxID=2493630 RepID=UPI003A84EDE4